ncbi:MAG: UvrD-helicase domain-containing protein [Colwellia sp.]|jgi:Superfamily I DNA and RNA helicases
MAIKYSPNQLGIIESPRVYGKEKRVIAYAGCGKSTLLIGYSNARVKQRILYICFNTANKNEAKRKFPKHVVTMTMHGLAYQMFGKMFKERLSDKITSADYLESLASLESDNTKRIALAYHSLKAFEVWCGSADGGPNYQHILGASLTAVQLCEVTAERIIEGVLLILKAMRDSSTLPVSHSLYLKMFQLSNPVLPYDTIMVDEAQDLNAVVQSVLDIQTAEIVKVGDPHQSIYEFRGAGNFLMDEKESEYYWLTQTYRFGPNLASLATQILQKYKGAEKPLVGFGADVAIDDFETMTPEFKRMREKPLYLMRTKAGIIDQLSGWIDNENNKNKRIHMPGGSKSYGFSQLMDAYRLKVKGDAVNSMAAYASWEQYCSVQELTGCPDAKASISLIEKYKGKIPFLIMQVKKQESSKAKADLLITTAHKSKGLEHPYVILGGDYPNIAKLEENGETMPDQEINLMYVSLTRAEKGIELSTPFKQLLHRCHPSTANSRG